MKKIDLRIDLRIEKSTLCNDFSILRITKFRVDSGIENRLFSHSFHPYYKHENIFSSFLANSRAAMLPQQLILSKYRYFTTDTVSSEGIDTLTVSFHP